MLHEDFLAAGVRLFGVSVDTPGQQAAVVEHLALPFPMLSDPDRSQLIGPLGLRNEKDPRGLAIPALVLFSPGEQDELWRWTSRDYADRMPEQEVVERVQQEGWSATTQPAPAIGPTEPGPKAVSLEWLSTYLRGAKFAVGAFGKRHKHHDESIKEDSIAFVEEMDRFIAAVKQRRDGRPD